MGVSDSGIKGEREFPATSWSVIVHAQDPSSPDYARHLQRLVEMYWRPVYCVIRGAYRRPHDDAKDLTQDFFATVVFDRALVATYARERGSFRALLRTALTRFMHDVARGESRQKRGAGVAVLSLDRIGEETLEPVPGAEALTPEQVFDVAWNEAVLSEAVALLEARLAQEGKGGAFEVFRRYDLEGDSAELSYAQVGEALSLTAPQVKHALLHARAAFRDVVRDLVLGYVDDPAELASELRSLFGA